MFEEDLLSLHKRPEHCAQREDTRLVEVARPNEMLRTSRIETETDERSTTRMVMPDWQTELELVRRWTNLGSLCMSMRRKSQTRGHRLPSSPHQVGHLARRNPLVKETVTC